MAKELFEAIQSAEESAEAVLREAQHQARDVLKEAETVCVENERAMAHEHRVLYQSILEEKKATVNERIKQQHAEKQKQQDAFVDQARAQLDAAAQIIFERVVSDGNR